jgi:hypothetical protein
VAGAHNWSTIHSDHNAGHGSLSFNTSGTIGVAMRQCGNSGSCRKPIQSKMSGNPVCTKDKLELFSILYVITCVPESSNSFDS